MGNLIQTLLLDSTYLLCETYLLARFWNCIPIAPGPPLLVSPQTVGQANLQPPVTLTWNESNPAGEGCSGNGKPVYRVSLSQSSPPYHFREINATTILLSTMDAGIWFWTVTAVNPYFSTEANDIFSFQVHFTH